MEPEQDWWIDNCKQIAGVKLCRKKYSAPRKDWDHDHYMACWAKFADLDGPEIAHEGYATTAESEWERIIIGFARHVSVISELS
jgi:hypothetical protein